MSSGKLGRAGRGTTITKVHALPSADGHNLPSKRSLKRRAKRLGISVELMRERILEENRTRKI